MKTSFADCQRCCRLRFLFSTVEAMTLTSTPSCKLLPTLRYSVYSSSSICGGGGSDEATKSCSLRQTPAIRRDHLSQKPAAAAAAAATTTTRPAPGASPVQRSRGKDSISRMQLRELKPANASRFVELMEKHGYVVLTDVGVIRQTYLEFMQLLKAFFEDPIDAKESCKGLIHFNERGIPMWHAGYERCGQVREAFRIPASSMLVPPPSLQQPWPCDRLRFAWASLLRLLQLVCHRALTLTLGRPVHGAPSANKKMNENSRRRPLQCSGSSETPTDDGRKMAERHIDNGGSVLRHKTTREVGMEEEGGGCLARAKQNIDLEKEQEQRQEGAGSRCFVRDGGGSGGGAGAGGAGDDRLPGFGAGDGVVGDCGGGGAGRHGFRSTGQDRDGNASTSRGCGVVDDYFEGEEKEETATSDESCYADEDNGDDFSVSYALHYPNEFADPALEKEDLTVGEHVDPSLFVAEPCCGVEGLEIQDRATGRWLAVEGLCASLGVDGGQTLCEAEGRELVLFGGKALERATEGRIKGAPHRVRRGNDGRRYCFIYEQKYAEFFPSPALD